MITKEKIVFLSSKNTTSTNSWSGIPYFMHQHLMMHYQVQYVKSPELKFVKLLGYYFNRISKRLTGKKYLMDYGIIVSSISGFFNSVSLRNIKDAKFVFCPAGLTEIAFLKTDIPIVTCGDCSVLQLVDYYPSLSKVLQISKWEAGLVERRALRKAKLNFFSSSWASDFVTKRFGLKNVKTVSFGANLKNWPQTQYERTLLPKQCKLIFVGVDWERKGGELALQVGKRIREMGVHCILVVIGSSPKKLETNSGVEVYESIEKLSGSSSFEQKLKDANFMILPTLADCTPIVIAEAFAFSLPVVASNTGGLSTMIKNNVNGFLIDERDPALYASIIIKALSNPEEYSKMTKECFTSFKETFNWDSWMNKVNEQLNLLKQE